MVIDVTVTSDNLPDPNTAHMEKVNKYSPLEEITSCVERNGPCNQLEGSNITPISPGHGVSGLDKVRAKAALCCGGRKDSSDT